MTKEDNVKKEEKIPENATAEDIGKSQNKLLAYILIFVGSVIVLAFLTFYFIHSTNNFEYKGVKYQVWKEGHITFYRTVFPMYNLMTGEHTADYNMFIRNDPRNLRKIPFEGEFNFRSTMVVNSEGNFTCDGDGIIAVANMVKFFQEVAQKKVIKDENATCDPEGKYGYINIIEGNETKIVQTGPVCYEIRVSNCEILKSTERFMTEGFSKLDSMLNQK